MLAMGLDAATLDADAAGKNDRILAQGEEQDKLQNEPPEVAGKWSPMNPMPKAEWEEAKGKREEWDKLNNARGNYHETVQNPFNPKDKFGNTLDKDEYGNFVAPSRWEGELDEPPPPPPGMLPPPTDNGTGQRVADSDNPEAIASGRALPASVRGPSGPRGPAPLSPDRQYEKELRGYQEQMHSAAELEQHGIQKQIEGREQGARDLATAQVLRDDEEKKNKDEIDAQQAILNQEARQRADARLQKAEKVRAMNVDPQKWYKKRGTAGYILAALASGFGAFGANMPHSGGKNFAQDILNKSMNDEIEAQKSDIEQAQKDLDSQVAEDDKEYARGQHKIASMNSAKLEFWNHATAQIQSVMARTEDQAKLAGMEGVLAYSQKQQIEADKAFSEHYREVGNHELAQQQAARAAAGAQEKKDKDRIYDLSAKLLTDPNAQITEEAAKRGISREQMALMSATALVRHDSRGAGLVNVAPAGAAGKLTEDQQNVRATDEFNSQIADIKKSPIITGTGLGTAALATLPQRVAPGANREQTELDAINTRMLQAIGKVAKDADGKPNKEMIQRIEKTYAIHLGEPPEQKIAKLTAVQDIYNSLARQQGAANAPLSTKK